MGKRGNDRLTALMGVLAWKTAVGGGGKSRTPLPKVYRKYRLRWLPLWAMRYQARPDSLSISSGSRVAPLSAERAKAA